jgi:hypothetical protein
LVWFLLSIGYLFFWHVPNNIWFDNIFIIMHKLVYNVLVDLFGIALKKFTCEFLLFVDDPWHQEVLRACTSGHGRLLLNAVNLVLALDLITDTR